MDRRTVLGAATAALLLVTCACASESDGAGSAPSPAEPAPSVSEPSPSRSESAPSEEPPAWLDDWDLGARVLPLRPDGFGQVRRTPRELRVRRMPTVDALPPPERDRFAASISRITPRVRDRMGTSWEPGCPVGLRGLRYVRVVFWGFDRTSHTGELIVRAGHARGIVRVFRTLYDARFPIEQMTLPTSAERDPTPSGDGNGTGAMVCRATTGATTLSAHAYGMALDLNPFQNPYVKGDLVLPELSSAYLDRSWRRPGMVHREGPVVRAFAEIGWSWGGDWRTLKDYQHFTATGR